MTQRNSGHTQAPKAADATIVNPALLPPARANQVCGQCHGEFVMRPEFAMKFAQTGAIYQPGSDLHEMRHYPSHPASGLSGESQEEWKHNRKFFEERWWDDGTILAGGREYTALLAARCSREGGMTCLACHSMHRSDPSAQLKQDLDPQTACLKCHREPRYTSHVHQHTFHTSSSSGSRCLNCHMPHTTYALFRATRSHQISSPHASPVARHAAPNACNLCHLDKTLGWTSRWLVKWYHHSPVVATRDEEEVAASLLWLISGNAVERVVAAWHMGWPEAQEASGRHWLAPFLAMLLEDDYQVVRYVAQRSLSTLPAFAHSAPNFMASVQDGKARAKAVREVWKSNAAPKPSGQPACLMDPSGTMDEARIQRLFGQRDIRSVTIQE